MNISYSAHPHEYDFPPESIARLDALVHSWAGVKSRLTPTGAPFEWVFTSYDARPRATHEVAPPGVPLAERFDCAAAAIGGDWDLLPALRTLFLVPVATEPALWIGARGRALRPEKLYVGISDEARDAASRWAARWVGDRAGISACPLLLRMVGYDRSRLEFYYRAPLFEPWHIPLLLRRFGLPADGAPVFAALAALAGHPIDNDPPREYGLSLSFDLDGRAPTFALHAHAARLVGRDRTTRARLLDAAARFGWDLCVYAEYTLPLAESNRVTPFHNILSLVEAGGRLAIGVGVAPLPTRDVTAGPGCVFVNEDA